MALGLHQLTAATYLVASVAAALGLVMAAPRMRRAALAALWVGVLFHAAAFWQLHELTPTPPLTQLPLAISLAAWLAAVFFLVLTWWVHVAGLAVVVAPAAFLAAFFASVTLTGSPDEVAQASPLWAHLHVLLASAGLSLVGVAGAAGLLYVVRHRELKRKRLASPGAELPSLEALDRLNAITLSVGFLLLTLGVLSGVAWTDAWLGRLWPGGLHANATALAWALYALLVGLRFAARDSARQAALHSAVAFGVLLVAVVGVGIFA